MACKKDNWHFSCLRLAFVVVLAAIFAKAQILENIHDRPSLEMAKQSPGGAAIYFGKILRDQFDAFDLRYFYRSYKKAAKYMKDFGVTFCQVDCTAKPSDFKKECGDGKGKVIFYSKEDVQREEEFELPLLQTEDQIIAHALHFLLVKDVPIVQQKSVLNDIINDSKGKKDVILASVEGLGDSEDRYFMEAAFVYGKQHQFVLTTESSVPPSSGALWYYQCKKSKATESCKITTRKNKPNTVLDVIQFLKLQGIERVMEMQKDGSSVFDKMELTFPINKVYLFDEGLELIKSTAESCLEKVDDSFYFILVDIKSHSEDKLEKFGLNLDSAFPNMVFQSAALSGSQQSYYEQWPLDKDFTTEILIDTLNEYRENPNKAHKDVVELVNIEYDTIDSWKEPKHLSVIAGCMKELDSCAAFKIAFRRLARSLVYSLLDFEYSIKFVDFTGRPDDARLNTLPGFKIWKNGKEYKLKGEIDYDSMLAFSKENLSPKVRYFPLSGSDHIQIPPEEDPRGNLMTENGEMEEDETEENQQSLVEMEDDVMSKLAVNTLKKGIQDENVTSLTEKTFNKTRDENELMITLFYLRWCVKSIIFRDSYAKVAETIEKANNLVKTAVTRVDCFNWNELCHKENVVRYPVIKVYRKGISPITYTGAYDVDTLVQTIQMLQAPVLKKLADGNSLKMFTDGDKQASQSPASVLGIFKSEDDSELATFRGAAEQMFGQYSFAYVAGNMAKQSAQSMHASLPSFMVLKRNDPVETMVKGEDFNNMKEFIEKHSVPSFGELTALNFPKYNMIGKPLVIQFKQRNDTSMDRTLKSLSGKTQSVMVTWMDMDKTVTQEIMKSYNVMNMNKPVVVLVSHKKAKIYKYTKGNDVNILLKWTKDCLADKVDPVAVLEDKEWKPLREGYDYLDLVKKAEERKKYGDTTIEPSEQADEENTEEAVASEQMKEKPRRDEL